VISCRVGKNIFRGSSLLYMRKHRLLYIISLPTPANVRFHGSPAMWKVRMWQRRGVVWMRTTVIALCADFASVMVRSHPRCLMVHYRLRLAQTSISMTYPWNGSQYLRPLLHGLCGSPLPWYLKWEKQLQHVFIL
jgi:hypothetical protein